METQGTSSETIFEKIIARQIPAEIVYQDDTVTAFKDHAPKAPVHILVVPTHPFPTLNSVGKQDEAVIGRMVRVAAQLAKAAGISETGYRVVINCNPDGGQEVYHLHLHLLGGEKLGPMR